MLAGAIARLAGVMTLLAGASPRGAATPPRGVARAALFVWSRTAAETVHVYAPALQ